MQFTESELDGFKRERVRCLQEIAEHQTQINRLQTRAVELQGIIGVLESKLYSGGEKEQEAEG